jgi:hypothetical protein
MARTNTTTTRQRNPQTAAPTPPALAAPAVLGIYSLFRRQVELLSNAIAGDDDIDNIDDVFSERFSYPFSSFFFQGDCFPIVKP